jgi:hypothetical protein
VAEKVYLVYSIRAKPGPVFTAIAARRKYIYIAATAGIELYIFLQHLLQLKIQLFAAAAVL